MTGARALLLILGALASCTAEAGPLVVGPPEHVRIIAVRTHPDAVARRCGEALRGAGCTKWLGSWCQMLIPIQAPTAPVHGIPMWGGIPGDGMAVEFALRQQCEAERIERGLLPPL